VIVYPIQIPGRLLDRLAHITSAGFKLAHYVLFISILIGNEVKLLVSDLRLREIAGRAAMQANDLSEI